MQLCRVAALLCAASSCFALTTNCATDGKTDVTLCLRTALSSAVVMHDAQVILKPGTYLISDTLTIPNKTQLIGNGIGDSNLVGTVILASSTFTLHAPMIKLGPDGQVNMRVQVKELTLDAAGRADYGVWNHWAMEESFAYDVVIANTLLAGIDVETSAAQNSGPFRQIEIYPTLYQGSAGLVPGANNTCITVKNVISFRGMEGITCNGAGYTTQPNVALQVDSSGRFSDIHIEHYATGVHLGSPANSADGLMLQNVEMGPDVQTGVTIDNAYPSQNVSLFDIKCVGCQLVLNDEIMGNYTGADVGWYLLGNGAGNSKRAQSSVQGMN